MNKAELVEAIAKETGLSKKAAGDAVTSFTNNVTKALKKKESVVLTGFGTFSVAKRSARKGINPQTGDTIKIAATVAPKFKAGKLLKDAVAKKKK